MVTDSIEKAVLLFLLKDFSNIQTTTSLAQKLRRTRVGIWKVLKKLAMRKYLTLEPVGRGKTSTAMVKLNWENVLVEKTLPLYLTEEALKQRRWQINFNELESETDFTILFGSILFSPQHANDIDILNVAKSGRFVRIQQILDHAQKTQSQKIHALNFTGAEFYQELKRLNKTFREAINKGVILFGQERFVKFMKKVHAK